MCNSNEVIPTKEQNKTITFAYKVFEVRDGKLCSPLRAYDVKTGNYIPVEVKHKVDGDGYMVAIGVKESLNTFTGKFSYRNVSPNFDDGRYGFHVFINKVDAELFVIWLKSQFSFNREFIIKKVAVKGIVALGRWDETVRPFHPNTWSEGNNALRCKKLKILQEQP